MMALGIILGAQQLRSRRMSGIISGWMHDRSILPVRIALLILLGLVSLANELGMELVLGAYTAGAVIAVLVRGTRAEVLENRLMSIGSGFFIPLFFITSGVEFDLPGLFTSAGSIARLILFFAGFLLIRIIPVRLYKSVLPENDLLPLALLSSTTMPLAIVVTFLGVRSGDMLPENAHAIVGAAVITVTVFPAVAIRAKPGQFGAGKKRGRGVGALMACWFRARPSRAAARTANGPDCHGGGHARPSGSLRGRGATGLFWNG
jgi:Kef-type K+ transport system membrane component KefB